MPRTLSTITNTRRLPRVIGSPNVALANTTFNQGNVPNLYSVPTSLIDPGIDDTWGSQYYPGPNGSSTYYDYYFSGQDIKVTIDGCETDANYSNLPISGMTINVSQEVLPIYGYNSYVYDALAKGKRVVSGQFILITRSPDYLLQAVALAAYNRSRNLSSLPVNYAPPLTEDTNNILTYWGTNQDESLKQGQYNLFSEHPPFTFMVQYGIQSTSVNQNAINGTQLELALAQPDNAAININDRLVSPDPTLQQYMVILLDGCQLIDMRTAFDTTGKPVGEMYSYIAHDIIYPTPAQASQTLF